MSRQRKLPSLTLLRCVTEIELDTGATRAEYIFAPENDSFLDFMHIYMLINANISTICTQ